MRFKSVEIAGFRGFPRAEVFDLDADAIIVAGVNGSGKTSMFDALLWGLTGSIQRIQGEAPNLVSMYSPTGEARVALLLGASDGSDIRIVRRFDQREHLIVQNGADELSGPAAEARLLDILWPDAKFAPEPQSALSRSLTRATYLQQDLVREFVESDSDQGRFQVVSELVGVGRVEELQRQLEASRNSWSRATNTLERELAPLRTQLSGLQERISRLGPLESDIATEETLQRWISEAADVVTAEESNRLLTDRSAQSLDRALGALDARQRSEERRAAALERLVDHLDQPVAMPQDPTPHYDAERAAETALQEVSRDLAAAQEQAAQRRRVQIEQAEQRESLRTLAELALHHLGETCPVCGQTYDEDATRARLSDLVGSDESGDTPSSADPVVGAAARVEAAERNLAEARVQIRAARAAQENRAAWDQTLAGLMQDAGLDRSDDLSQRARAGAVAARGIADSIRRLRAGGERLSVQLARSAELAQRSGFERQAATLTADLATREQELASRLATGDVASLLLERLRDVNAGIVSTELRRIEPLLQRIYAQVDPHPSFRAVNFLTRTVRGRGRLWTSLGDATAGLSITEPSIVLSSSQLNVLAVSTFLSLNLAIESLPLQVVALDDPLQSLDTVNLLGLADLLRRVKASRQVIVSTHDERLAALLARKLRPVSVGEQSRLIRLQAWSREGPIVEQESIAADVPPLRLAASA